MARPSSRAPLSKALRQDRIRAAERKLADFLAKQEPVVRKLLRGPGSLTHDERSRELELERQGVVGGILNEYFRILIKIPDEWRKVRKRQGPSSTATWEWVILRKLPKKGAPKKNPQDSEDVLVSEQLVAIQERLKAGVDLRRTRKAIGGSASDDELIGAELKGLGYGRAEIAAILESRTPEGAAARFYAVSAGRTPGSVSVSRARAAK